MKFLASITIVLSIPTIIASLFGRNVRLPFESHPHAFLMTLGISVLVWLATIISGLAAN